MKNKKNAPTRGSGTPSEEYYRANYDTIKLRFSRGTKARLERLAKAAGVSVSKLVERWAQVAP